MIFSTLLFTCCALLSRIDGTPFHGRSKLLRRSFIGETKGCDRDCQKECIAVHNKYRANHDAPPLVFDQKLADEAQALIDKGVFKHSDWVELKNNGAAFAWGSLFPTFTAVIKNWHDEGAYYDYQTGAPKKQSQVVDHFMQMVYKKARKIGCARGGLYGEPWYVVHYDKAPTPGQPSITMNINKPKQDDSEWFKDGSPFSEELKNMQEV